nr:hypothetical protein [Tanacetum cinerariifolium]
MALTFADTHNMIAFLTKSYASEWFDQIIDFLNDSSIKYALTVNPNIYVSVIKQFWSSVSVKNVNDVTRLQALVDRKKVIITEVTIREALRLDDAESIYCLPNEEIFTKLERIGYEKPSTKLTFYKAFFSSQWKFLIHKILQCMSAKRTAWNEFSSSMALAVICLFTGKGFSGVETPLFEGMIMAQQVGEGATEVNVDDVPAAGVTNEDADDVNVADDKPSIPSLPPTTQSPPPPQEQEQPSTSQVGTAKRVETSDDTVMDDVSKQGGITKLIDADKDVSLENVENKDDADVQGRLAESQAQIYQIDLEHADKVLSMQDDDIEPVELKEVNIDWDEVIEQVQRKEKKDNAVMRYQALKRKPQTESHARKNMMIYLRNMARFKMDYFKGMSYDDIRPIFEKKFNLMWLSGRRQKNR